MDLMFRTAIFTMTLSDYSQLVVQTNFTFLSASFTYEPLTGDMSVRKKVTCFIFPILHPFSYCLFGKYFQTHSGVMAPP